jgi:DNA-binding PadR family transcriptional regulator
MLNMPDKPMLTYTIAAVLHAISLGHVYGYGVMEATGLQSGTVYPALGRLERDALIVSRWEKHAMAEAAQRPARKYYKITRTGSSILKQVREQYPLLAKIAPAVEVEQV